MAEDRELLHKVHVARLKAHGYNQAAIERSPWPSNDKEWRQTDHGAPWDTNVMMAKWHLAFAQKVTTILEEHNDQETKA